MGQFIDIGLALTVKTNLNIQTNNITIKDFSKSIEKKLNIDMSLYELGEDEKNHTVFDLSNSYLGGTLVDFIQQQVKISNLFYLSDEVAEKFMTIHNIETLKQYIEDESPDDFQMRRFGRERIDVNDQSILIQVDALSLATTGKILFDGDEEVFEYFERNVHMQNHPLAKCIKVQING